MTKVTVDFSTIVNKIKPMHCINNAPLHGTDDRLFHYLREAGIPAARLHDTGGRYGGFCFVDIENIFRDFAANPADPAAYDFAFTDWLLGKLVENGSEPFYRLGATIENSHRIKAYHIYPPKDNLKWAKICEGIIRHYNEGWANGFHFGIRYWEIWNEPDNEITSDDNPMWKGNKEQYFALYETAANYLKQCFPDLKIGGYASCGFYALSQSGVDDKPNTSPREEYFMEFFTAFMEFISSAEHKSPLDFFSWHSYSGIQRTVQYAEFTRSSLDRYGFNLAESILNEWNPGIAYRGELRDAAAILGMMCALQKSSVDMLMYYDGQVDTTYGGMFNPLKLKPFKAYYAFAAFNELYKLGYEASSGSDDAEVYVCAAAGSAGKALLIDNTSASAKTVTLHIKGVGGNFITLSQLLLDENHNLGAVGQVDVQLTSVITLPAFATFVLKTPAAG
jgi:xylan 1,4-beta-xylosidase